MLRGRSGGDDEEWCNRRVLARIHRRTIGTLRREIEPVIDGRLTHGSCSGGSTLRRFPPARHRGRLQVVRQVEGYEMPAVAWETSILPRRVAGYKPEHLDSCASRAKSCGEAVAASRARRRDDCGGGRRRRVRPTKLVPISLFARDGAETLIARGSVDEAALSHPARDVFDSDPPPRRAVL